MHEDGGRAMLPNSEQNTNPNFSVVVGLKGFGP